MTPMKNTGRQITFILAFGMLLVVSFLNRPAVPEDAAVTNDDVYKTLHKSPDFEKSHSVMRLQKMRLNAIFNGFLIGDTERIAEESDGLLSDMNQLILSNMPTQETESSVWRSVAEIVEATHSLKDEVSKNNYSNAYGHFARVTASCIQCHQVMREWGKFPQPETPSSKTKASAESEKQ